MKNIFILLFVVFGYSIYAQQTHFNTKKGFVIEGFDVVSYFESTPQKGSDKYVSSYKGAKFKFYSQKNLNTFNNNPEMYIPQYGGYCAYAVAVKGEKVSIDPETFEIRDGKLYLFYNSWGINTLNSWLDESPNSLKIKADNNWKHLD
ncbi:YHS domain-containing (seleno)protein [Algibacter sp. L1A34]|uniref:YHS domain-containing (seleno)protein n=1 Tax=Algibacter sp. L1A34 TaxID=2686365 RepID=UPI00131A7447|nr:YHS domain-containing (seleno)protein [Algibacter sp. L1A34]